MVIAVVNSTEAIRIFHFENFLGKCCKRVESQISSRQLQTASLDPEAGALSDSGELRRLIVRVPEGGKGAVLPGELLQALDAPRHLRWENNCLLIN